MLTSGIPYFIALIAGGRELRKSGGRRLSIAAIAGSSLALISMGIFVVSMWEKWMSI